MQKYLRLPDVMAATGLARSSIYAAVSRGDFPAPVKLSARAVAWPADEVTAWLDKKRAARDLLK